MSLRQINIKKWMINLANQAETFGEKRKSTGFIYVPGSKFRLAEGHLSMRSCLQDAVIISDPRIGKYIDKSEL